jgi:hypothetical protein
VGDTTNVAARMQQAAEPGHVLISEATHRLVSGYFDTRDLGELSLKGKAEPVRAWDVVSSQAARTPSAIPISAPASNRRRRSARSTSCQGNERGKRFLVVPLEGEQVGLAARLMPGA